MTNDSTRESAAPSPSLAPANNNNINNTTRTTHRQCSGTDPQQISTISNSKLSCADSAVDETVISGTINHNGFFSDSRNNNNNMGTNYSYYKNDDDNTVAANRSLCSTPVALEKLSVKSILSNRKHNANDVTSRSHSYGDSPTAVADAECHVVGSHPHIEAGPFHRSGQVMKSGDNTETRRRNYSSSSLPLSLMTATIEEVDDGEYAAMTPNAYNSQRSHSYSGTATPSTKVPFRALRREARVSSLGSPPRTRRPGPLVGLVRSASDNTAHVSRLRDVDIVGESSERRFPWQRDIGVQCHMAEEPSIHPHLQRAMSGPAMYTYFRSLSLSSNSPASSPPQPPRRPSLHRYNRSCSHSDLVHQHPVYSNTGEPPPQQSVFQRHPGLNRSNSSNSSNINSSVLNGFEATYNNSKRANFWRRPRPSSLGAVENIRYQHELTKFRELHNSRRDRKSDPQLVLSPGGRRRTGVGFPDETGSVSDLESILENPGDRPWDISRQTS
ncbi:unnamed protein product, partial [Lymnaea stagnalis]